MSTLESTPGEIIHPVVWADILVGQKDGQKGGDDKLSAFASAVEAMVAQLTSVLFGSQDTVKLCAFAPKVQSTAEWQTDTEPSAVIIEFIFAEQDQLCAILALNANLIGSSLAGYLGAPEPFASADRPSGITSMESRYLSHIAPALMETLQPLSRLNMSSHRLCVTAQWQISQAAELYVACVALAQSPEAALLSIAIPTHILAINSEEEQDTELAVYAAGHSKVRELGRTKVKVDVFVRAADLTLERIRSLSEGDVIGMEQAGLGEARAIAKGQGIFAGQIGRSGGAYSIRVTQTGTVASKVAASTHSNHNGSRPLK